MKAKSTFPRAWNLTKNTHSFVRKSTCCVKLWAWRRHINNPWTVIHYLWCFQSKAPKCSHPKKLLKLVSFDKLLISLTASSLKQANHIFRTSMNMWRLLNVGQDFILLKFWSNLTFYITKEFCCTSTSISSLLHLIRKWNWPVTKLITNNAWTHLTVIAIDCLCMTMPINYSTFRKE